MSTSNIFIMPHRMGAGIVENNPYEIKPPAGVLIE